MRRRDFIAGLMFTATMGRAQAQSTGKVYRIAFAHPTTPVADINQSSKGSLVIPAIFEELIRLGYVEGRNLLIERYSGEGRAAHYPELVRAVVSSNPDLVIAVSNDLVLDFKAATTTIPIVGAFASPVETGIVASLARPGGNITGASVNVGSFPEQWGKRIQLLQQVVPAARLAFLQSRRMREQVGPKEESNWLGVTSAKAANTRRYPSSSIGWSNGGPTHEVPLWRRRSKASNGSDQRQSYPCGRLPGFLWR